MLLERRRQSASSPRTATPTHPAVPLTGKCNSKQVEEALPEGLLPSYNPSKWNQSGTMHPTVASKGISPSLIKPCAPKLFFFFFPLKTSSSELSSVSLTGLSHSGVSRGGVDVQPDGMPCLLQKCVIEWCLLFVSAKDKTVYQSWGSYLLLIISTLY